METDPVYLLPRRRPGHLGRFNVGQLVVAETALVGVLVVLGEGPLAVVAAVAGAAVVLAVTLGRRQGRWWLERQLMSRRLRRRRARPAPASSDGRLAVLRRLAPGLVVENVAAADGSQVGVARDGAGWFAVTAVEPGTPLRLDILLTALADVGQWGAVLQVVIHTVPADPGMEATAPANRSYHQLLATCGAEPVPADRAVWITVRLDAHLLAEATPDNASDLGRAPAVTTALLRRVTKELRRVGARYQVLDADQLLDALARSSDVDGGPVAPAPPVEEWTEWRTATLAHRSFWVRGWPPVRSADALIGWLVAVPAAMTDVSLTLVPDGDSVDLRCLVRVAAPADRIDALCRLVVQQTRKHGADLFPLDGEQAPAVYASAPSGGGAL